MTFDEYFRRFIEHELQRRIEEGNRLTQAEFSEAIGYTSSWIGQYLSGNVISMRVSDAIKVCEVLGANLGAIVSTWELNFKDRIKI